MKLKHVCEYCDSEWECPDRDKCSVSFGHAVCPDCVERLCTPSRDWVIFDYSNLPNLVKCTRCGEERSIANTIGDRSMYLDEMAAILQSFGKLHWRCEETHGER